MSSSQTVAETKIAHCPGCEQIRQFRVGACPVCGFTGGEDT